MHPNICYYSKFQYQKFIYYRLYSIGSLQDFRRFWLLPPNCGCRFGNFNSFDYPESVIGFLLLRIFHSSLVQLCLRECSYGHFKVLRNNAMVLLHWLFAGGVLRDRVFRLPNILPSLCQVIQRHAISRFRKRLDEKTQGRNTLGITDEDSIYSNLLFLQFRDPDISWAQRNAFLNNNHSSWADRSSSDDHLVFWRARGPTRLAHFEEVS